MSTAAALPLSRERILACAVRIADRDGLDATSLRKVAAELGVHVTSLYNHVATKDALLDGVIEELFATAGLPVGEMPWEDWVRAFMHGIAQLARDHSGAFAVLLRKPVQGARANATFEAGLEAFTRAGMDVRDAYAAVKSISLAALGLCIEIAEPLTDDSPRTDVAALPEKDFPVLHQITAVADDVDIVEALTEVLVAGFAHRIAAAGKPTKAVRSRPRP